MTTDHLPISIPDILRGKTVEWEHLEFKAGWNSEAAISKLELTQSANVCRFQLTKPARPLAEAQIGGSLVYGGQE